MQMCMYALVLQGLAGSCNTVVPFLLQKYYQIIFYFLLQKYYEV
jgi:hypothetical protein